MPYVLTFMLPLGTTVRDLTLQKPYSAVVNV
jgi:hypothetical protein